MGIVVAQIEVIHAVSGVMYAARDTGQLNREFSRWQGLSLGIRKDRPPANRARELARHHAQRRMRINCTAILFCEAATSGVGKGMMKPITIATIARFKLTGVRTKVIWGAN
jgi:hypothetical protein